jgi:hypothetical protein
VVHVGFFCSVRPVSSLCAVNYPSNLFFANLRYICFAVCLKLDDPLLDLRGLVNLRTRESSMQFGTRLPTEW